MKTITKNIYSFNELSKKAQEKAHQDYKNRNTYEFLEQYLLDELNIELEENNIKENGNKKVLYSLSYSQGDGVCFIGDFIWEDVEISITHNFRYYHRYSTDINGYFKSAIHENVFKELYYKICKNLEKTGYSHIEYEDSIETFKELCKDTEYYMFYEDGTLYIN